jgi:DNA-binding response OmpR family regulator
MMALPTNITGDARILIVDDDARCASGLARMLKKTGYTACTTITSPTVATERFPELKPDLVLLDLHMDRLSGIDVLKKINEMTEPRSRPPIVMLTADTTVEAKYDALAAGATAFLAKPLDLIEVILRIENLLTTAICISAASFIAWVSSVCWTNARPSCGRRIWRRLSPNCVTRSSRSYSRSGCEP